MQLDFILGGAQKSGTTSLHHLLSQHPAIQMPMGREQETHFFDLDDHYSQGLDWLAGRLPPGAGTTHIGLTCPIYLYLDYVPQRIRQYFPNVKFLFILRDPVNRAYSSYWHERKKGREKLSFEHALQQESDRIVDGYWAKRRHSYFSRGLYYEQLNRYVELFGKEQVHVLLYEELFFSNSMELADTFTYLGVDSTFKATASRGENITVRSRSRFLKKILINHRLQRLPGARVLRHLNQTLNTTRGYPHINPKTEAMLIDLYREDRKQLAGLLGRELPWKKNP